MTPKNKTVQVKQMNSGQLYFDIKDFSGFVDIEKVDSYQVEIKNDTLTVVFFNKSGKLLPVDSRSF